LGRAQELQSLKRRSEVHVEFAKWVVGLLVLAGA